MTLHIFFSESDAEGIDLIAYCDQLQASIRPAPKIILTIGNPELWLSAIKNPVASDSIWSKVARQSNLILASMMH